MLQLYTRIAAVALTVTGAAAMSGVLKTIHGVGLLYLSTAAIFAYAGFRGRDTTVARSVVGGMGVLYLLSDLILLTVFLAGGLAFEDRQLLQSLVNATFGGLSMLFASARFDNTENSSGSR